MLKIAIASDHAGFDLKQQLFIELETAGYNIEDMGTYSNDSVDYPDIAKRAALAVTNNEYDRAILICGTGIGMCISSNKVEGIRAGVCSDTYSAKMSRLHNNANILAMGSRVVGLGLAVEIAKTFLDTNFESGTRHEMRVNKINQLDNC